MPRITRKSDALPWVTKTERTRSRKASPKFHNSTAWRRCAKASKAKQPFCEACKVLDDRTEIAKYTDHIIRVESGGAKFDDPNLMNLCGHHHDSKNGKERHTPILCAYIVTERGKIPSDRNEIFKIWEKKIV